VNPGVRAARKKRHDEQEFHAASLRRSNKALKLTAGKRVCYPQPLLAAAYRQRSVASHGFATFNQGELKCL
jgi:hypothetical protein